MLRLKAKTNTRIVSNKRNIYTMKGCRLLLLKGFCFIVVVGVGAVPVTYYQNGILVTCEFFLQTLFIYFSFIYGAKSQEKLNRVGTSFIATSNRETFTDDR